MRQNVISEVGSDGRAVTPEQVRAVVAQACPAADFQGKRVLLIVPDATRTAPIGLLFKTVHAQIAAAAAACDVMIALGTHPPMTESAICDRLEITAEERRGEYGNVQFLNHEWDNPAALTTVGTITAQATSELTGGLFAMDVEVKVNRRVFDYEHLFIIGPVFPHEVVGCSGGNKYLFPGISGPEVLNFFHWLGAVLSCAPPMYNELWTGGKCMYKLEPVVADGGELIIYAPHIREVSRTHGHLIEEIGYHCRDYFLSQWDRFKHLPWGTLAHSTHVRGIGRMENGVERCRVRVTLATGIPPETCARINLGYRDPATIDVESFAHCEDEGVLLVRKAGEMLYHLREQPDWAGGSLPR
jgi:nickel-dependent lactate racemase